MKDAGGLEGEKKLATSMGILGPLAAGGNAADLSQPHDPGHGHRQPAAGYVEGAAD